MITLPTYRPTTRRSAQVGGAVMSIDALNSTGDAMAELGDNINQIGQKIREQKQRADLAEANRMLSDADLEWTKRLQDAQQNAADGAPDFAEGIKTDFDAYRDSMLANVPEYAREHVAQKLHYMGNSLQQKAITFEGNARLEKQVADLGQTLNNHANIVRSDGEKLETSLADMTGAINASSLSDHAKAQALANVRNTIVQAHYQGEIQRNPQQALHELNAGGADTFLTPAVKNSLLTSAGAAIKRQEAEARQAERIAAAEHRANVAELRIEVSAAVDALNRGVEYQGLDDLQTRADALDPKLSTALRGASEDLSWQKNLLKLSPADMRDEIDATRTAAETADTPELASTLAARADRGEKAFATATKALKTDPLGWAAASGTIPQTDLLGGLAAAANDQEQRAAVIRDRSKAVTKTAETFGVSVPFLRPSEVEYLGDVFNGGDTAAKVQALGVLNAVPANELSAVLQDWKADKPDVVAAVGLARTVPRTAELIVRGRDIRKQQPRALPKDTDYIIDLDESLNVLNARPDVRREAEEAIKSVIANQAVEAGDLSGDGTTSVFEQRLQFATRAVLGNVVEWNDNSVLPPTRTMTQPQFDALMDALPDEPMGQSMTGSPVTGADIREYGQLEAIGQGQYRVRMHSGYVLDANNRPFILNLRGVK